MSDLLSPLFSVDPTLAIRTPRDWEHLLGQAWRSGLSARVGQRLDELGWAPRAPEKVRIQLDSAARQVANKQNDVALELGQIHLTFLRLPASTAIARPACAPVRSTPRPSLKIR